MNKRKINQVIEKKTIDESGEVKTEKTDTSFYIDSEPPYRSEERRVGKECRL